MRLLPLFVAASCYRAPPSAPQPSPPKAAIAGWLHFDLPGPLQSLAVRDRRVFALADDDTLTVHTVDGTLLHRANLALDNIPGPHNVALDAFSHRPFELLPVSDQIAVVIGSDFAAGFDVSGHLLWGHGGIHISADQQVVRGAVEADGDFADIPNHIPTTRPWLDLTTGRFSERPIARSRPEQIQINYDAFPRGGGIAIVGSIEATATRPYRQVWQHAIRPPRPAASTPSCPSCDRDARYYLRAGDLIAMQPDETTIELVDRTSGSTFLTLPLPARQGLHRMARDGDLLWIDLFDMTSLAEDHHLIALDGSMVVTELSIHEDPNCRTSLKWQARSGVIAIAHQVVRAAHCTTVIEAFTR